MLNCYLKTVYNVLSWFIVSANKTFRYETERSRFIAFINESFELKLWTANIPEISLNRKFPRTQVTSSFCKSSFFLEFHSHSESGLYRLTRLGFYTHISTSSLQLFALSNPDPVLSYVYISIPVFATSTSRTNVELQYFVTSTNLV